MCPRSGRRGRGLKSRLLDVVAEREFARLTAPRALAVWCRGVMMASTACVERTFQSYVLDVGRVWEEVAELPDQVA